MSLSNRVRLCLSEWINLLLLAVPIRSRGSFVELLCGCMVSPEGWVTRAISAIARRRHWTTYYKLLGRGSLRTVRLARQLFLLVLTVLPCDVLTLVIDDTLVPRSSEQAPGCAYRHDHSRKINRPQFIRAQCWVTLGVSALGNGGVNLVLPILSRLVPNTGNRNKLKIALVLVRSLAGVANKPVRVLFDSWFMRARLVLPLLRRQMHVIGQARIDTALFLVPPPPTTPRRGRKRIYGERLNAEAIEALPAIELRMPLYGKDQQVRLRSAEARARFLKGALVRAVWCQFFDAKKQAWTKPRLLLASETDLSAQEIVQLYARRWGIEPLFHNLKRWFGVSNLWQQSRTVLELWMQIRSMAWTLNQLLSLVLVETFPMNAVAPWRMNQPVTAGLVTQWLRMEFTGLAFRDGLNRKSQKFQWPTPRNDTRPTS
ncbi:transposase [Cupriavidus sp. D39]|uniref:IS701 family transposase n=1 Tax=Cupriavidus sp. D39 TaxID=2997877 RepID=UPI002271DC32|nr:transposase [Cupriavidus sp. D39]MCY0852721.1 transposase [Cupriavidus sp. D39]MCY0852960.1 transposase [Cupriavidus sp. D39]MCY0853187.1 transposase [Cupriavidus sp. D39]MCY0853229.1 transposase [Cupriavidus sp. D39]MCY0853557.1 transposase [Cupriavidus sp. D39]